MQPSSARVAAVLLSTALTACGGATRAPEAPAPSTVASQPAAQASVDSGRPSPREVDVRFMQHMLAHHAQALVMTALVPERSRRDDIRLLAERIDISQRSEIAQMQRLLRERGVAVPSVDSTHAQHAPQPAAADVHASMPGMLGAEEIAQLRNARDAEFDRLFLQYMIRHHEGALTMVAEFFATPGAGQGAELFQLASDIDADQRAEIRRMRSLHGVPAAGAPRR